MKELNKAMDKVTSSNIEELVHGDELQLTDNYVLYKYTDDDFVVIVRSNDNEWEEVLVVQHDGNDNIEFEQL